MDSPRRGWSNAIESVDHQHLNPKPYTSLKMLIQNIIAGISLNRTRPKWGLLGVALLLFFSHMAFSAEFIDINDPFIKKVPIAIPRFKAMSQKPEEIRMAGQASKMMTDTLDFTGYFKIINPAAFLEEPHKTGIVGSKLHFANWTVIGTELLITGGMTVEDDTIAMECRLFDTFKQTMLVGRQYKGRKTDVRRMVRRFCSEVFYLLTGSRGFFESKIAFVSNGTGTKEIYICDFDGHQVRQVTHSDSITLSPAWSSDGKWLAYTSYEKGKPDLYLQHLKEGRKVVVDRKGSNITPAWMPGKFSLAACLSFKGDQEIYLLTGNGKIIKRLTESWGIDVSPTFSPDGRKMAFVSKRAGTPQIYVKDLKTGQVRRLTYQGHYNTSPSWSPEGNTIAYVGIVKDEINIYRIQPDGSGLKQLTANTGDNESPTWSPDGSLIAFCSTREGPSRIFIMSADGTRQRRLLAVKGDQTHPRWSPESVP
jgi:TolB protein